MAISRLASTAARYAGALRFLGRRGSPTRFESTVFLIPRRRRRRHNVARESLSLFRTVCTRLLVAGVAGHRASIGNPRRIPGQSESLVDGLPRLGSSGRSVSWWRKKRGSVDGEGRRERVTRGSASTADYGELGPFPLNDKRATDQLDFVRPLSAADIDKRYDV